MIFRIVYVGLLSVLLLLTAASRVLAGDPPDAKAPPKEEASATSAAPIPVPDTLTRELFEAAVANDTASAVASGAERTAQVAADIAAGFRANANTTAQNFERIRMKVFASLSASPDRFDLQRTEKADGSLAFVLIEKPKKPDEATAMTRPRASPK